MPPIQDRACGHWKQQQIARGSPTEQPQCPPMIRDPAMPTRFAFEPGAKRRANYAGYSPFRAQHSSWFETWRLEHGSTGSAVAACPRAIRGEAGDSGKRGLLSRSSQRTSTKQVSGWGLGYRPRAAASVVATEASRTVCLFSCCSRECSTKPRGCGNKKYGDP